VKLKILILLSLFLSLRSYSQGTLSVKGIWIPVGTKSISGIPITYDLGFSRLEFSNSNDSTVRAYDRFIINGEIRFKDDKYEIKDSTLRIQNSFFSKEFLITLLTETQLGLTSGGKNYLFTKMQSIKNFRDISSKRLEPPVFKGNLRESIDKALFFYPPNDTSGTYRVSFKIDKTGELDSITIKNMPVRDSLYKGIEALVLTTAKKWKPGKSNGVKEKMKVELDIYRMSALARNLKQKNHQELLGALFTIGSKYHQSGDKSKALICYKECANLFNYIASTEKYSPSLDFVASDFIKKTEVKAVMNSALIYFEAGDIKKACKHWVTVIDNDPEALELYNKYYKSLN